MKKIFGEISKVEPQDDGTLKVYGFASAPVRDAHGEIVTTDAMQKAIEGYMKFPAVREMHDATKAAGRALDIGIDGDGKTSFVAHVVDPGAVKKVQTQTYAGFSIGGRVKKRSLKDSSIIDEIDLIEVSLVDRPSCPDAVINLWKADGVGGIPNEYDQEERIDYALSADEAEGLGELVKRKWNAKERRAAASSGAAMGDGSFPIEDKADLHDAIQAYGRAKDKAKAKAHIKARAKALGATGMLPDDWKSETTKDADTADLTKETPEEKATREAEARGKETAKAEPEEECSKAAGCNCAKCAKVAGPETEVKKVTARTDELLAGLVAAVEKAEHRKPKREAPDFMKAQIELRKGMHHVADLSRILMDVAYHVFDAKGESEREGDDSPVPDKLRAAWHSLAEAYRSMSDEELSELASRVDDGAITRAATVSLTELQKTDGPLSDAEALTAIVKPLAKRGLAGVDAEQAEKLAKAETAIIKLEAESGLQKAENAALLAKLSETNDVLSKVESRVTAIVEARLEQFANEPVPAKTAGSVHATVVEKAADRAGDVTSRQPLTEEDIARVLGAFNNLPKDDQTLLLTKAALSRPRPLTVDPAFSRRTA